ncbi:chromate reductase [Neobacillus bataviensis LMG 21833]|uniref:NAD(P)H-dependent oxidoreductase n=3 Tax=Bacillaceae TaxID=186817 RepID=A0A286R837_9BACI|nr:MULTISPECIES: NADPH-dependent FMN reductase [Bacillaceae]ASV70231.1 NAD(P)H-dependent oxidoreductase [Cytobacillus kochii]EKN67004.1 chromate reductase [Neobacillus bataviensis LMG 21833]MBS4194157.1 NAD(P)H-dependent oxidoreductase [Lederbergia citri]
MNIVVLVGSLRKESYNMQLAKTMQERYKEKMNLEIADIRSLPHFDQDEENNPPQSVKEFKEAVSNADGVVIITPEYNWSIPGVLKNALDWASRVDKVFIGKPVMALGATMGMLGTVRAQMHLREILDAPGIQARILPPGGNEVLIGFAHQKFDEQSGQLVDEGTLNFLDSKVEAFIDFVKSQN